jgi:methylaspartate mutase sigma subunit
MKRNVVIGTIGADAHMIGGWILKRALTDAGFSVTYLGAVVPQDEFINAAIETNADAIFVSSLYGMGIIDCEGFRAKCVERGIGKILLYVGGHLVAPLEFSKKFDSVRQKFMEMGFNRVYPPNTEPEVAIADLKKDLGIA